MLVKYKAGVIISFVDQTAISAFWGFHKGKKKSLVNAGKDAV